ncbi:MAG: DUF2075 domain-containing protein [Deltaproteobacteria bacterium]|nr:MAG: DUF2075 domain-containing protein [Deltaproteobacteria bacterium]
MSRSYYSANILTFLQSDTDYIIGRLAQGSGSGVEGPQTEAWREEIRIMRSQLIGFDGSIFFEYSIPRIGHRIDVLLLIGNAIFVLEFKVGDKEFRPAARDQVWDYALDLKNFHETSHDKIIVPILIATAAIKVLTNYLEPVPEDQLLNPIDCLPSQIDFMIREILSRVNGNDIVREDWENGRYSPTPTIIEAARALYNGHSVNEISRRDASDDHLRRTSEIIETVIKAARLGGKKAICFVTGVPGAGKTLVGMNVATRHAGEEAQHAVFLSGNGPLVKILSEALARDSVNQSKITGEKRTKKDALRAVKSFIQIVHHYRDDCLVDESPPKEHVALFDEAQRACNLERTSGFMKTKKNRPNFNQSEPEFLISCLDRHLDWAVVVCLVGGGQEINTGEAGISEWLAAMQKSFSHWDVYISPNLTDSEYGTQEALTKIESQIQTRYLPELHLSVSMRSFRAEHVSALVKYLLDRDLVEARITLDKVRDKYPVLITRDLAKAKRWLKTKARGTERFGMVVSSQAQRLKPYAIDVKSPMDPVHWFLDTKEDVRSSYYLEDVATEFDIQGLELDWVCVTWDADFRYTRNGWEHRSFVGSKWNWIIKPERQFYQKNAYRVLLTRARQGMVIVVPPGDPEDHTRLPEFYNPTYEYLKSIGFDVI